MQKVIFQDLGMIDYKEAWDYQQRLIQEVIALKRKKRTLDEKEKNNYPAIHYLLFCQHPPVYTLGKSGSLDNLLLEEKDLERRGFDFYKINRGGDITYHGPGQIVVYPIFDLDEFFTDVHRYVRYLEEVVIRTLTEYGLQSLRMDGFTGVWFPENETRPKRKICAIGVHLSRWVTMHGLAFNIDTNLEHFNNIVPCGIKDQDKEVTSLTKELNATVDMNEVKEKLKWNFAELFEFEYSA